MEGSRGPWRSQRDFASRRAAALCSVITDTRCKVHHLILTSTFTVCKHLRVPFCTRLECSYVLRPHFGGNKTKSGRLGCSLVARMLALDTGSPEFNSQCSMNQTQWQTPEVKSDFQGHCQIHGESEDSLGYVDPVKGRKGRLGPKDNMALPKTEGCA